MYHGSIESLSVSRVGRFVAVVWCCGFAASAGLWAAAASTPLDAAPFGQVMRWNDDGTDYGIIWEDARDVFRVEVTFADAATIPRPEDLKVEYWQSSWPESRIPRDQPSGAGGSGWLDVGDWFAGKWQTADIEWKVDGAVYAATFHPIQRKEFSKLDDFDATYRTTLKIRVLAGAPLPAIRDLRAFTDSVLRPLDFEIEWAGETTRNGTRDGRLEVFNGALEQLVPLSETSGVVVGPNGTWQWPSPGKTTGVRARIVYAEPKSVNSFDATIVTVHSGQQTFSFAATDLMQWGHIYLPDFGVIVRKGGDTTTYAAARIAGSGATKKSLYSRVFEEAEQTLTRAWADTPAKSPQYIPLGFEGGRQIFGMEGGGNVFCVKNRRMQRLAGRDSPHFGWKGERLGYQFGLPESRPIERFCIDGDLPIIVAAWEDAGVRYRQTAFAVPLAGVPAEGERILSDDTMVLLMRIAMENIGEAPAQARLDLNVRPASGSQKLTLQPDGIIASAGEPPRPRMRAISADAPDSYSLTVADAGVAYRAALQAKADRRTLDIAIPYIILPSSQEWGQLRSMRFEDVLQTVRAYWRGRIDAGTRIRTPEPMINEFYNATVSHQLINVEREVDGSDRYMAKVGSFYYGVFGNESCMMINDLDCRGYHERARQALDTWLHYQGTVGLPGDFSTVDGQFYGAGGYEEGGYNQHHGWILWCLAEHYWYTRDADWLRGAAPKIVKGCDWIIHERQRTIAEADRTPIRAIERGLLPPGGLEDIGDNRSWLATNVYTWWGMANAGRALEAIGHADGSRLREQAEAYRRDIVAAFTEAMRRSPVVRLRDGSWVPHVPSEVHRRGRSFGWITETLEGAIHIVRCGMLDPEDPICTWIIKDYEDNLYLSKQFGYDLQDADFDRLWFSHGGISMQANLLCNPIPYILRDEPKHFLRAYFNAFAVSFFPDTRMMTEHALPNIGDWRGDHYKTSDEANSTYWLRLMFVREHGDELWLGAAIPRYWLAGGNQIGIDRAGTYFGPMSMTMVSDAAAGRIEMTIDPPRRNPPKLIRARFRHSDGKRMVRCELNGKPYDRFDAEREWVELPALTEPARVTAIYQQ